MISRLLSCLILLCLTGQLFALEKSFYIRRSNLPGKMSLVQSAYNSVAEHAKSVDILISQAYQIDEHGIVSGFIDKNILQLTRDKKIKLMLLITNINFDKEKAHVFLLDEKAQDQAINSIVQASKDNKAYGVQLDFEMIALADRDLLTKFYKKITDALHQNNFVVSAALAPTVIDSVFPSEFSKRMYRNWEGAYDIAALGKMLDFVSIMSYNQHGVGTTAGPTAGAHWVEDTIKYALKFIPAEKISLGIPTYSSYWYTDADMDNSNSRIHQTETGISYEKAMAIVKRNHAPLYWSDHDKGYFAVFERNWLNEYVFIEDAKAFAEKMKLVSKYHLRGISAFELGVEDPGIWQQL